MLLRAVAWTVGLGVILNPSPGLLAQDATGSPPFGGGTLPRLSDREMSELREMLDHEEPAWGEILRTYFGTLYDASLADLIVYIPSSDEVRQALIQEGEVLEELSGEEFLWVLVFSTRALCPDSLNEEQLELILQTIVHTDDPFLTALISSFAQAMGRSAPVVAETHGPPDTVLGITLEPLGGEDSSLYVAMERFPLTQNTMNRLSVTATAACDLPKDRSIHFYFGNSTRSRFGVSLGGGFTFNAGQPVFNEAGDLVRLDSNERAAVYLLGHLYPIRSLSPKLPWEPWGVGLTAGTNIFNGSILDDLIYGLSLGRLDGLGLVVGVNWTKWREKISLPDGAFHFKDTRKTRLFLGLDYAF